MSGAYKKLILFLSVFCGPLPMYGMESNDAGQGYFGRLCTLAKEQQSIAIPVTLCAGALLVAYWFCSKPAAQDSCLTVYNMSDRIVIGSTDSVVVNGHYDTSERRIVPYQSFYDTQAVTYTSAGAGINHFNFRGIVGPTYTIAVHLKRGERAILNILDNGYYTFKGKTLKAKQV